MNLSDNNVKIILLVFCTYILIGENMLLSELNKIIEGDIYNDVKINKIRTNSKEIKTGDLFLAINKGHEYIDEAIDNGAGAIICEKDLKNIPYIKVSSTIKALGQIANYIKNKYNIPLIAVTGSVGKTTTKELISLVLSKKYKVLKSINNNNNHIGLPLTLLNLDDSYDVIVTELGMNHKNEISYLSKICQPDYAIITNIGTAHIGNLGSKKEILKAKLEILDGMKDGYLIINNEDRYLKKLKIKNIIKVDRRKLKIKRLKYNDKIEFDIDNTHFIFNSYKHLLSDVFLAIKMGLIFNMDLDLISEAIYEFQNINGRLNTIKNRYTIIDDSYNSSYESLIGGLQLLKDKKQFKYIVIGDMLELGKYSKKYHKKINKYLKKINNKQVLLIGEYSKFIHGKHFDNIDNLINYLRKYINNDCLIYIKGSRALYLDKIKETLN